MSLMSHASLTERVSLVVEAALIMLSAGMLLALRERPSRP